MSYKDIEKQYRQYLEENAPLPDFLQNIVNKYLKEESLIEQLFNMKYENANFFSDKELEFTEKEEKLFKEFILLCGEDKKEQAEELFTRLEENFQGLVDVYTKEFYKLGIKDAKEFMRFL